MPPVPYFDHNATHPLSRMAREAWLDAVERYPANPSSRHRLGTRAGAALDDARERLAAILGCRADDLVWTSGATESNNAVIHHLAQASEGEVWVSSIEHPCVHEAASRHLGSRVRFIPVRPDGVVDLDWVVSGLTAGRPAAIVVMAVNNETGVLQPWERLGELCRDREITYFCDAAQWVGKLPARGLGECAFATGCAHKFGGPTGAGFLKATGDFRPQLFGGMQEEGRRPGTENLPGVLAMVAALEERELAMASLPVRDHRRSSFIQRVLTEVPGAELLGGGAPALWNTVTLQLPAFGDCRLRWVVKLDRLGFQASTGSACAGGREKPSRVLAAMGRPADASDRTVRFSGGWETADADWDALAGAIVELAEETGG
jgi:cysteine desulfurase